MTDSIVASTAHLLLPDSIDFSEVLDPVDANAEPGGWVGGEVCAQLVLAALRHFFASDDRTDRECMLGAVLCAAVSIKRLLPLAERALALPEPSYPGGDVGAFVAGVQMELVRCLSASRLSPPTVRSTSGLADLFDGRLFRSLLACFTAGEPLPPGPLFLDSASLWTRLACRGGALSLSAALSLSLSDEDRQAAREWRAAAVDMASRSRPHTRNHVPETLHPVP